MKFIFCRAFILIVLVWLIAGCQGRLSRDDPLPSKVADKIENLESITAPMTEWVPQMVVAVTILDSKVQKNATIGEVCDAIAVFEPKIQNQQTIRTSDEGIGDPSTVEAIQEMLDQLREINQSLGCETIAKP